MPLTDKTFLIWAIFGWIGSHNHLKFNLALIAVDSLRFENFAISGVIFVLRLEARNVADLVFVATNAADGALEL